MRINQLKFLVELKKEGSFSKVADKLFVSQPSISRAIKELEEELGYLIVKRGRKGVCFTEQGELVLENALTIMDKITNIEQTKNMVNLNLINNIYIGASFYISDAIMPEVLINFNNIYSMVATNLKEDCTSNIIENVAKGELDIGVIMMYDSDEFNILNEIKNNDLKFSETFRDEVLFFVRPGHPLAKKYNVQMKEVLQYQYVTCTDKTISQFTKKFFKKYGYVKEIIEIRNRNTLVKYIMMSDAITTLPKSLFNCIEILNKSLLPVIPRDFNLKCKIGWIHKKDSFSIIGKKFIDEFTKQCKKLK